MARRNKAVLLGQPTSAKSLAPVYGVVASGTVGFGTAAAMRYLGKDKYADLAGLGAGVLVGVGMLMTKRSKAAGMLGVYTALLANGLRFAETMFFPKEKYKAAVGQNVVAQKADPATLIAALQQQAGLSGAVSAQHMPLAAASAARVPTLGAASAQRVPALGIVSPEVVRSLSGSPVQFEGMSGPPVTIQGTALAGAYGATITGGGRD